MKKKRLFSFLVCLVLSLSLFMPSSIIFAQSINNNSFFKNINFNSTANEEALRAFMTNQEKYLSLTNDNIKNKIDVHIKLSTSDNDSEESELYKGDIKFYYNDKKETVEVEGSLSVEDNGVIGTLFGHLEDNTPVSATINYVRSNKEPYVFLSVGYTNEGNDKYMIYGTRNSDNDIVSKNHKNKNHKAKKSDNVNDNLEVESIEDVGEGFNEFNLMAADDYDLKLRKTEFS